MKGLVNVTSSDAAGAS